MRSYAFNVHVYWWRRCGADYPLVGPLPGYGTPRDCCCNDWLKYNCSGQCETTTPSCIERHARGPCTRGEGGRGKGRCVAHAAVRLTCSRLLPTADIYNAVAFTGHPGVPPTYTHRHQALLSTKEGSTRVAIVGAGPGHSIIDGQGGQHSSLITRNTPLLWQSTRLTRTNCTTPH